MDAKALNARIAKYREWIALWKARYERTGEEEVWADICDLESWINKLSGWHEPTRLGNIVNS